MATTVQPVSELLSSLRPSAGERILRVREHVASSGQHIGYADSARRDVLVLRALLAQDSAVPYVERCAHAFAAMLTETDTRLGADDLLAGAFFPAPPDQARWEAERRELTARVAWPTAPHTPAHQAAFAEIVASCRPGAWFGNVGQGHANVNFEAILQQGMCALAADAELAAARHTDPQRAAASRAMAIALRGAIAFAERYAALADALLPGATPARAAELRRLAAACRRVPAAPATTFFEALQAVWFTYLLLGLSESPSANSLGCIDRYLFPFYARDLAAGTLTPDGADELICHFLLKCGAYAEGQALTLGGRLADGTDATNALSRRFFKAIPLLGLPEPIISVRVHDGMAPDDLASLVAITAAGQGHPSYYHEDRCRAMLANRDVAPADRERLAINSCMGVIVAGAEVSSMWGAVVSLCPCLELAVSGGVLADGRVLPHFAALTQPAYDSLEDLIAAYVRIMRFCIATQAERHRVEAAHGALWHPNPFLSALLDDCRERGLDRLAGGPRYTSVIVEAFGWANVSDSLVAIDELVFRRRTVTLPALLQAARADYAGHEALLRDLRACPKYGNDHPVADAMARRVLDLFIATVRAERRPGEHAEYLPSLHTLNNHASGGAWAPVSFDGRRLGAPLNKQQGPSDWATRQGPTAVLASAAKMPTDRLTGGQALDISVPGSLFTDTAGRERFAALLQTYFRLGGADLQVNTCSADDLRRAMAHPEDYRHLIVRVAGYSEYFTKLSRPAQQDLATRVAAGL